MNVAILGFDREGQASYDYFVSGGHTVTICDQQADKVIPEGGLAVLGEQYLDDLERFDLLVRTPGMKPQQILGKNPTVAHKITSGSNEFFKVCPTRNIIGVTGTKGKGTTSVLITKMLEASGKTVHLGGNIGNAAMAILPNIRPNDWVVLELSSFQLIDLQASPHIAVCLMVAPEHLDWHAGLEEYITAKEQLFARQLPGDVAVYYYGNELSQRIAHAGEAQKVAYFHNPGAEVIDGAIVIDGQEICRTDELKLLGQHNWQNACAAVTAVWYAAQTVTGQIVAMRSVLTSFSGLPYRIEFRRKVNGIGYYNDSFASAPPAPIAAMQAITGPKVMIIGGFDRNLDLWELTSAIAANASQLRNVLLIGAAQERLATALTNSGYTTFTRSDATTMAGVVQQATILAMEGDTVVLSPGFPSFDMFINFEDRGQQFNQAVDAL